MYHLLDYLPNRISAKFWWFAIDMKGHFSPLTLEFWNFFTSSDLVLQLLTLCSCPSFCYFQQLHFFLNINLNVHTLQPPLLTFPNCLLLENSKNIFFSYLNFLQPFDLLLFVTSIMSLFFSLPALVSMSYHNNRVACIWNPLVPFPSAFCHLEKNPILIKSSSLFYACLWATESSWRKTHTPTLTDLVFNSWLAASIYLLFKDPTQCTWYIYSRVQISRTISYLSLLSKTLSS